jgi:hypothetical protein
MKKTARHENWVPPRDEEVPDDMLQQHEFHRDNIRSKLDKGAGPLPAAGADIVTTETMRFVAKMFQKNPEAPGMTSLSDVMGNYYSYLKKFDPAYLKQVQTLANDLTKNPERTKKMIEKMVKTNPPVPAPGDAGSPPGGGPAGGMPPGGMDLGLDNIQLGSSNFQTKTSSGHMFLKRPQNSKFILKDTVIGKIIAGNAQYIKPDGVSYMLAINGEEVSVSRVSSVAKSVTRAHMELPVYLWKGISSFLDDHGVMDADYAARTIVEEYMDNGAFDLRPVSARLGGPRLGILLYEGIKSVSEPESIQGLREAIGNAMDPFVASLKSALEMEGIDYSEKEIDNQVTKTQPTKPRYPTRPPMVLQENKVSRSLDVASLVMTAASFKSDRATKKKALDRIVEVIAKHPLEYEQQKLSIEDMHLLGKKNDEELAIRMERLVKFSKIFTMDDDYFLRAYAESGPADRLLLASLAANQGRNDILSVNPEMSIVVSAGNKYVNTDAISMINPRDSRGLYVVREALVLVNAGQIKNIRPITEKAGEILLFSNDNDLIALALKSRSFLPYLAIASLASNGTREELVNAMMSANVSGDINNATRGLVVASITKNFPEDKDLASLAFRVLGAVPADVGRVAGRNLAIPYMQGARIDWDGNRVPIPSKIYSLGDDPMSLAKSYRILASTGDEEAIAGLRRLFHLASQAGQKGITPEIAHLLKFLKEALSESGDNDRILDALEPAPYALPREAQALPNGSILVKKGSLFQVDEGDIIFASNPEEAVLIAVTELVRQGK